MIRSTLTALVFIIAGAVIQAQTPARAVPAPSIVTAWPPAPPLATLRLASGIAVDFLDAGEGHLAMAERTPKGRRPLLPVLAGSLRATPLEAFMALAPGMSPPRALVKDHENMVARTGGPSQPRVLVTHPALISGLESSSVDEIDCDGFGENFSNQWHDAYDGIADVVQTGILHAFSETQWDFYPGGHIYYGTNANSLTFLGACNGDDLTPLTVEVHRRIKTVTPPTVSYTWHESMQVEIGFSERFTFASVVPAFYRARLRGPGEADPVAHVGIGAAYTKAPPIGIAD